jgi:hypothetical protein
MTRCSATDLVDALRMAGENGKAAALLFVFERSHAESAAVYAQVLSQLCEMVRAQWGLAAEPNTGLVEALTRWSKPGAGHRYLSFAGGIVGTMLFGGTTDDEGSLLDVVVRNARQLEIINRTRGGDLAVLLVCALDEDALSQRCSAAIDQGEAMGRAAWIGGQ